MRKKSPIIGNFGIPSKLFFQTKSSLKKLILVNNDNVESKETGVAKNFNDFFLYIVKNLEIREYKCEDDLYNRWSGSSVLQAIIKYRNHLSINTSHCFLQHNSSFYFSPVDKNTVLKEIKGLSANKAVQDSDIPVKALKENANFFAEQINLQFNEDICSSKYAESFKLANITPTFKQDFRNLKSDYRPISILHIISKIFEKLMCKQFSNHFDNF